MLKTLIETGLNYKVGIMTASSPFVVKTLGFFHVVDANITQIGLWFSVLLTITLILGHYVRMIWQNKLNGEQSRKNELEKENLILDSKKKDLENEELKLKVELLKLELREKQEQNEEREEP